MHMLEAMDEGYRLMAGLLYRGGMRLMELVRLRVKDLDLERRQILVRDGKGRKDRLTVLPERYRSALSAHLERVREIHARDLERRYAGATFWPTLARKYPNAPREWPWQYFFRLRVSAWIRRRDGPLPVRPDVGNRVMRQQFAPFVGAFGNPVDQAFPHPKEPGRAPELLLACPG